MLETERLFLRQPVCADLDAWTDFFASERARFVGGGPGRSALAWRVFALFLGHWTLNGTGPHVICRKLDGVPIGTAGPWFPRGWPKKELTWALWTPEVEGRGFATEAVLTLRRHLMVDCNWPELVSYIHPSNTASIRMAERLGCTLSTGAKTPDDEEVRVYCHSHG